jgi:hypothetical protein
MRRAAWLVVAAAACARPATAPVPRPNIDPAALPSPEQAARTEAASRDSARATVSVGTAASGSAADAWRSGWMPLRETGVDAFIREHPTFDGRGVLIAILDSGIDGTVAGLGTTSAGERKILDLRDFSGEGSVPLVPVTADRDAVTIAGRRLTGIGRVAAFASGGALYGGRLLELPLGPAAGDVNGNGVTGDTLPVVVVRGSAGWLLFADTDGDGSLANERPVADYLAGHETLGWHVAGKPSPLGVAVNFTSPAAGGPPRLDLFFDTFAHGTHVAGIAAGHDIGGVHGFDGAAPGAFLLGCKIANDAQGSVSTTGAMIRALDYAIRFASERRLPLVVNLSFGVGNEIEGGARIDRAMDSVLAAHPEVVLVVSAGNDGPGLSTIGFPASISRGITVGATLPSVFLTANPSGGAPSPIAGFSARGGELARPDLLAPGMAYSTVPRWNAGGEREGGTSMAAPQVTGLVAVLRSAVAPRMPDAVTFRHALMVTARPIPGASFLDQGTGVPDAGRALRWLQRGQPVPRIGVTGPSGQGDAAWQVVEAGRAPDTVVSFTLDGADAGPYRLTSSAPWLRAPASLARGATHVRLSYDARALASPGVYTGVVSGWTGDSLAGPAFRLVNTVVVAHPAGRAVDTRFEVGPGEVRRIFFAADSERPFTVRAESSVEGATLYLHEPGGMPYRGGSDVSIGAGDSAAMYEVGGRDVVAGVYQAVVAAPPLEGAAVTVQVIPSPVILGMARDRAGVAVTLASRLDSALTARAVAIEVGAERSVLTHASGSAAQYIPFVAPGWARGAIIETTMQRAQWSRFTDFGVTLFDSAGVQIGSEPLNYAVGRLQVGFPEGHGDMPVRLGLFPGFADSVDASRGWTVRTSIRLYADSALTLTPDSGAAPVSVQLPPHASRVIRFRLPEHPRTMGDGFFPLGAVVVEAGRLLWSREAGLSGPLPPVMR